MGTASNRQNRYNKNVRHFLDGVGRSASENTLLEKEQQARTFAEAWTAHNKILNDGGNNTTRLGNRNGNTNRVATNNAARLRVRSARAGALCHRRM